MELQQWDINQPKSTICHQTKLGERYALSHSRRCILPSPFYKEIKNLDGDFNPNIKAQKSYQIIIGNDYEFEMVKRPFKLTTEIYYKKLDQLIPYYIDNVRTRYAGENNSQGYSYGIDARLFGHFVPGVDSFISASYARVLKH